MSKYFSMSFSSKKLTFWKIKSNLQVGVTKRVFSQAYVPSKYYSSLSQTKIITSHSMRI